MHVIHAGNYYEGADEKLRLFALKLRDKTRSAGTDKPCEVAYYLENVMCHINIHIDTMTSSFELSR